MTHVHPSRMAAVAIAGLLTGLLALSLGTSIASAKSNYKTYMWCGATSQSGSECGPQNLWGTAIIAKDGDPFKYRVCVATPAGNKFCDKRNGNRGGEGYWDIQAKFDGLGKYRATWKVGGRFVGADSIVIAGGESVRRKGSRVRVACLNYTDVAEAEVQFKSRPEHCIFASPPGCSIGACDAPMRKLEWENWGHPHARATGEVFITGGGWLPGKVTLGKIRSPKCNSTRIYTIFVGWGPLDRCKDRPEFPRSTLAFRASCGLHGVGDGIYLRPITKRKKIRCGAAKDVAKGAMEALNSDLECVKGTLNYRRWTLRHVGIEQATTTRFTNGQRSFVLGSQGSC